MSGRPVLAFTPVLRRAGGAIVLSALIASGGCARAGGLTAVRTPPTAPPTAPAPSPSSSDPTSTTPLPRPLPVATMTLDLVDDGRPTVSRGRKISASRSLTTLVWYPSVGGPWPLVVFAHGFEVGPRPYQRLLETWAAAGYVVAAPAFPLTDAAVAGPDLDEADLDHQPADVAFVLASVLDPTGPLSGHVDGTRVGVAGHSDGAETALAVAADPPVALGAIVVMAGSPVNPGPAPGARLRGPLGPSTPLLVAQGDADPTNPFSDGRAVYDQAAAPRFLLTLLGGGHLSPFTEGSRYEDVVDKATVDFLNAYLARTGPSSVLLGDGVARLARIDADS